MSGARKGQQAASSGSARGAAPRNADQSAVLRTFDLYPLRAAAKGSQKLEHSARRAHESPPLCRSGASAVPPGDTDAALANTTASSQGTPALLSVDDFRSSRAQLDARVTSILSERLASLMNERLRGRLEELARADALLHKETARAASGNALYASPETTDNACAARGGRSVRFPVDNGSDVLPQTIGSRIVGSSCLAAASEGSGKGGGTSGGPAARWGGAAAGRPAGADAASAGQPSLSEHEQERPIELVRVHRLRGVPDHNRGLFSGMQPRPFTTRSGNLTVGAATAADGQAVRVRPGAWESLCAQGSNLFGHAAADQSRPMAQLRDAAPSSAGEMTMRTFEVNGQTFFQWVRQSRHPNAAGVESAGASDGAGRGAAPNGPSSPAGIRDPTKDGPYAVQAGAPTVTGSSPSTRIPPSDIEDAVNAVLRATYGRPLTSEQREEARRRLHSKRSDSPTHATDSAREGSTEEAVAGSPLSPGVRVGERGTESCEPGQMAAAKPAGALDPSDAASAAVESDVTDPARQTGVRKTGNLNPRDGSFRDTTGMTADKPTSSTAGDAALRSGSPPSRPADLADALDRTLTGAEVELLRSAGNRGSKAGSALRPGDGGGDSKWRGEGRQEVRSASTISVAETAEGFSGRLPSASVTLPNVLQADNAYASGTAAARADRAPDSLSMRDASRDHATGGGNGENFAAPSPRSSSPTDKVRRRASNAAGPLRSNRRRSSAAGGGATSGREAHRRHHRRTNGTAAEGAETVSGSSESDEDGQLNMFLANFPESEEHVKLRRRANDILAGLEDFDNENGLPMPSFSSGSSNLFDDPRWKVKGARGAGTSDSDNDSANSAHGFVLNDSKLREKFRAEAEDELRELIALRDKLRDEVTSQKALKEAFCTDIANLSDEKLGERFAIELTRETNQFAKEHQLVVQHLVEADGLMDGDIEEVAEGFLDRFWKGTTETRDAATQVSDKDLGYVDQGVRTTESSLEDLFYHENNLLGAIRLATIAVANIMSFHASLELEGTCRECFFLLDRPRTLWPCGHTFCQQCLAGMYNRRDELICAECGSICEVGYTPNLSVELIANYQVVQGTDLDAAGTSLRTRASGASHAHASGHDSSLSIEGILRHLLSDLIATQRACSSNTAPHQPVIQAR